MSQAVTNLTNIFGSGGSNEVIIKINIGCGGGTIIFHISCGGYATSGGLKTYTFRYKDAAGNIRATICAPFFLIKQESITHGLGLKVLQESHQIICLYQSNEMTIH